MFQGIVIKGGEILISSNIEKVIPEEYGDPDIDITDPYSAKPSISKDSVVLSPYMGLYTDQKIFSFRSEDIVTMFTPKDYIVEEYKKMTGVEEQLELSLDDGEEN